MIRLDFAGNPITRAGIHPRVVSVKRQYEIFGIGNRLLSGARSPVKTLVLHVMPWALLLPACSTTQYKEKADREVYGIIQEKTPGVTGMPESFSIETSTTEADPLAGLPRVTQDESALGDASGDRSEAALLSLEQALHLAVSNSRTYQNRKESLYLAALSLTLDRHRYTPIFSGGLGTDYGRSTSNITESTDLSKSLAAAGILIDDLEALTGTTADLLRAYANVV